MSTLPVITTQPQPQVLNVGSQATFTVIATSTTPLTYQWYYNCEPINGATSSTYTINSVSNLNIGVYDVIITNTGGSIQSNTVPLSIINIPLIISQPQSQVVNSGSSTNFTIISYSSTLATFQWYLNGQIIPNATNPTYLICSAQSTDAGNYNVVITNSAGSVTSLIATLTVNGNAPVIIEQPNSQKVSLGSSVKLCVKVLQNINDTQLYTYKWYFNKKPIKDSDSSVYKIKDFSKENEGRYYVVITNSYGCTKSTKANLEIKHKKSKKNTKKQHSKLNKKSKKNSKNIIKSLNKILKF